MKKESEDEEFWIEPEEQHEECQDPDIICEWNEDECYEFGGTEEDRITSSEEVPDFVQQFAEKQDREEREEKIFAAKVMGGIAIAIGLIFYGCWKYYVG